MDDKKAPSSGVHLNEKTGPLSQASIQPRTGINKLPLSFAQQRLWILHQLDPNTPLYNEAFGFHISGQLNVEALFGSINAISQRHEILRTIFPAIDNSPVQVVEPPLSLQPQVTDLRALPSITRESTAMQIATTEARRPFDLSAGPLFRVKLFRLDHGEHWLLLVMHHIIWDAWSSSVFYSELSKFYEAYSKGYVPHLPTLPIQYGDFAIWQRQWLQGEVLEAQISYWKQQLTGSLPVLQLPSDRPREAIRAPLGERLLFTLSPNMTTRLKTFSRREGVTLFMTLRAALLALLYRYTGEEHIIVGSPIAGRNRTQLEELIGCFVNMQAVPCELRADLSFREHLSRVRGAMLDAYTYQDLPFEKLVEELNPARDLSHTPLAQVVFSYRNALHEDWSLSGLTVSPLEVHNGTAKFDLTLDMVEKVEGLVGRVEYSSSLFDRATITRLFDCFRTMLDSVVDAPEVCLADLPLLTESERLQLLDRWEDSPFFDRPEHCLHELFEAQARRIPDRVAIAFDGDTITYQELNQRANQLAHCLQQYGVRAEVLVGLYAERSLEMIIGILGILKAGGAYLPLDPDLPKERLEFLLQDSNIPLLLTQEKLTDRLPQHSAAILRLDADWSGVAREGIGNLENRIDPSNAAYVIYTSGSTGRPKGVIVEHRNVAQLFSASAPDFSFSEQDTWVSFHSIGFDFSVWEIWGALLHGGRLVLAQQWVTRSPEDFHALLCREGVTVLNQTPSAFSLLMRIEEGKEEKALPVRLVIFGGEALEFQSLQRWFRHHPDHSPQLVNMYGITETTVHVTYRPLRAHDASVTQGSMIGTPIPHMKIYLLDGNLQPVPIGVPGELFVGGAGITRGYLNRSALTAERFIPHPYSANPGERLYKSGDLARYLPSGDVEYLGRIDNQVKIRGFRIELGEIEAVLSQHPLVRESVALVEDDSMGHRRLVAFVTVLQGEEALTDELHAFLQDWLPEYMVPYRIKVVDAFPLTPHGKVDRRSLLEIALIDQDVIRKTVVPSNELEDLLAAIWASVLGIGRISMNDKFFDLGGDSIRAIEVVYLARERGHHFSVQTLFKYQTIRELAEAIRLKMVESSSQLETARFSLITDEERSQLEQMVEDAYPLARLQAGMLFHAEYSPESSLYHDVLSYHIRAPFHLQAFQETLIYLAARHPILRTSLNLSDFGRVLQLVHRTAEIPLNVEDLRHLPEDEQEDVLLDWLNQERSKHFDWAKPPLLRVHIHRRTDNTCQLTATFSHIILDGWSFASLLTELFEHYLSLLSDVPHYTPTPLTLTFRDFVALEQRALQSEASKHFWASKREGFDSFSLPRWSSAPHRDDVRQSETLRVTISQETSESLQQLALSLGVPIKSVLLAAHLKVLSFLTAQSDTVTGVVLNGRPESRDGQKVLGLFLNTVPLRLNLAGGSWRDLILQTFQVEQELLPYRWYPLAQMQADNGGHSLFDVSFGFTKFHVYQNLLRDQQVEILGSTLYEATNFALSVQFRQDLHSPQIYLTLLYNATDFPTEQIETIGNYYLRVLVEMAVVSGRRHGAFLPFSDAELQQILLKWNDNRVERTEEGCFHHLFTRQVQRTPDAYALVCGTLHLTYRALNARVNQLAHYLQGLGVGVEVRVGIWGERSADMIIGMLGVLKAGGTYVPLDAALPKERLNFVLADAGIQLLLMQERMADRKPSDVSAICLDSTITLFDKDSESEPVLPTSADSLAYIIYTSGSTGQPKGVGVEHKHLLNHVQDYIERLKPNPGNSFLLVQSLAVDASIQTIALPLCTGGCLHILSQEEALDADFMSNYVRYHRIDYLKIAPSHLMALHRVAKESFMPKRWLILGGEATSWEWMRQLQLAFPECNVISQYGPTEAAVAMMTFPVRLWMHSTNFTTTPLGRPITNVQLYILDRSLNPVVIGAIGELHIGGSNVARGYVNRPELTADRYIPDPFSGEPSARLYKTGDLVRYLPDGNIEYISRSDEQVKIRGFRVEPSEVQLALDQHSGVSEVVVVARRDQADETRLVAYVVPVIGTQLTTQNLRNFLQAKLPTYMIPSSIMLLPSLPHTGHGKVDRQALPVPFQIENLQEITQSCPRTPTEQVLADLWATALGLDSVGIDVDFLNIGGDSLLATYIIARARDIFQVALPLRALFEASTIAGLAERIDKALASGSRLKTHPIRPIHRDRHLAVSFAQQRLWILEQMSPGNTAYNVPMVLRLHGSLSEVALERSLGEIIRRHEILRSTFPSVDGRPVQRVVSADFFSLPLVNLVLLPGSQRETVGLRLAKEELQRPFDLDRGPLIRAVLLRLNPADHLLVLTMHHIVTDWWSNTVLATELGILYGAYSAKAPSPLPDLSIQYADFAQWQRQLMDEVLGQQLTYWKEQLRGELPVLQLPFDRPRPSIQSFQGAMYWQVLPIELLNSLRELSFRENATMFMTLLAAYKVLLYRYTGQEDVLVGSPAAGRNVPGLDQLIGFFVNTLVLRTDLSGQPSFIEFVHRVRETALGAYSHQDLPLEKLAEVLQPERSLSHGTLFQVMFSHQQNSDASLEMSGITAVPTWIDHDTSKFDLTVFTTEADEGLIMAFEYNTDLFDRSTIERMGEHFRHLLEGIADNPNERIIYQPLLSKNELQQITIDWNDTGVEYPRQCCIHDSFMQQVLKSPDAVAVIFEDQYLTYRNLNDRSNQVAHHLQRLGVGIEGTVGLYFERSPELIVAILGVLKAGCTYVPLDTENPTHRLAMILEDAGVSAVLTQSRLLHSLPNHSAPTICLDEDWEVIALESKEQPTASVTPDNLAYIIYTSGSTGQPKGVACSHRAIVRLVTNSNYLTLTATDRVAQASSAAFDAITFEVWSALTCGAALVIVPRDVVLDPSELASTIVDQGITTLFLTTAALNMVAREIPNAFSPLRYLLFGGEAVAPALVDEVFRSGKPEHFLHVYGPTETTTFASWYPVDIESPGGETIPIGRPVSNTAIYLLDANLCPVPVGVSGEIFIGGDGVARGYLNRPELTAEYFVPDPFSGVPGTRLYRTGDLARYRPDGNVIFLDRIDYQVKVRGHRVETAEVEASLLRHSKVIAAVVSARGDSAGVKRLVAYFVPADTATPSASELITFLRQSLPDYMVPSTFIKMASLPITNNGKINRSALPDPDSIRPKAREGRIAPRNSLEQALAEIWCKLLELPLEGLSVDDDFFALGGHSLLITQVLSYIREAFGVNIRLLELYSRPTIAELAEAIARTKLNQTDKDIVARLAAQIGKMSDDAVKTHLAKLQQEKLGLNPPNSEH